MKKEKEKKEITECERLDGERPVACLRAAGRVAGADRGRGRRASRADCKVQTKP